MNWGDLKSIEWDELESTTDWVKTLNDLLELAKSADTPDKRNQMADKLDEFADNSSSDDLTTITKLDAAARKAARALRNQNIEQGLQELAAASADYRAAVKELDAATAILKNEAERLRAEKITAALSSLSDTIVSLKNLSRAVEDGNDEKLIDAINKSIASAQKLRGILESTA
jgi:type I site-specific restriction endonuclease